MIHGEQRDLKGYRPERKNWFMITIVLLVILSWAGSLDKYSDKYTNSAIVQAGSAYAVARGINATVSMLQTSTVFGDVGLGIDVGGSIAIGEILDPLNDLIERFSEVMTVALGSLVMQKILLAIAANKLFSGLLTLLGLLSVLVVWTGKTRAFSLLLKLFILLVVIRFSLGIVVLSNGAVSHLFLSGRIEESSARLGDFKGDINNLQREKEISKSERDNLKKNIKQDKLALKNINETAMPKLVRKLKAKEAQLDSAESAMESAKADAGFVAKWNPWTKNKKIHAAQSGIDKLTTKKEGVEKEVKRLQGKAESLKSAIISNRKTLEGDSEDVISRYNRLKQNLSVSAVEAKVSSFVQSIIDLLILFILKAILIPLLFFYLFMRLAKFVWKMDWEQLIYCNK